ncbi:MAG: transcription antitermination factor NusB [Anaerovoracaceae bacterium]
MKQMTRSEVREILMQIMYEMDAANTMDAESAEKLCSERLTGKNVERGALILKNIIDNIEDIDKVIDDNSKTWKTGRMPKVDLAIMRLIIGEIRYGDDLPKAVAVNEAINLAKKYSTERSSKFIHGVLGAVIN